MKWLFQEAHKALAEHNTINETVNRQYHFHAVVYKGGACQTRCLVSW